MMKTTLWILVAIVVCVLAVVTVSGSVRDMFTPAPQLDTSLHLLRAGKYEQAEQSLRIYLTWYPDDPQGRLTLAQTLLRRDDPPAREILTLLSGAIDRLDRSECAVAYVAEGQAHEMLHELRAAEACYKQAVALDLRTPQAVWRLMQLYYLEGREGENQAIALRRIARDSSPTIQVRFLRERLRHDIQRLAAGGLVEDLEAPYRLDPTDPHVAVAYGQALVRDGALDEGLEILKANCDRRNDADAWHAYLVGLDDAGEIPALKSTLEQLPKSLAVDPRFADARGQVALNDEDFPTAIAAFDAFLAIRPADRKALFRLERALRLGGQTERADEIARRERDVIAARDEETALYRQISTLDERAIADDAALCRRIADLRARLGHPEEASRWISLADRSS